jgi:antirestriction protein ArdC
MRRDLYAEVSTRIVAELERGAAPWIKPWSATAGLNTPCNAVTNRPYSGCNVVLLWMAANAGYRTAPHGLSGCARRAGFLSGQVVATMVDLDQIPPTIIG